VSRQKNLPLKNISRLPCSSPQTPTGFAYRHFQYTTTTYPKRQCLFETPMGNRRPPQSSPKEKIAQSDIKTETTTVRKNVLPSFDHNSKYPASFQYVNPIFSWEKTKDLLTKI
jgi:hypothetical protein